MSELIIDRPYPKQIEFLEATNRYIAYGGARGGGKSWTARIKATLLAINIPGIQILLLRRTLIELRENHVIPLRKLLKSDSKDINERIAQYKEQSKEFIFPNGSRIVLGYCANEGDVLQFQGQAYDVIFMEEATQFTEFQFQALTESNRSSGLCKIPFSPRMYFTANPGGVGHMWFKRLFIDREYQNSERPEDYKFIQALVYDNDFLMKNDPNYVRVLENLPEERKKAMLYGDWEVFEGQFFSKWKKDTHVIEPFDMPNYWYRYISIDWGYNDYCDVQWHATGDDGHIYTYRELHVREKSVDEVADLIIENTGNEKISYYVGSPDMWQTRGTGDAIKGENVAEMFGKKGLFFIKADNSRIVGWNRMREYMEIAPDGRPWWQITSNCVTLIKCIPQALFDEKKTEDMSTEPHNLTDPLDSSRYFLMSRPQRAKTPIQADTGFYYPSELEERNRTNKPIVKQQIKVSRR